MTISRALSTASVLALFASPALAELEANQVWADWKDMMESYGADLTIGSESSSGGIVTVSGLTANFELPDGSMSISIGDIVFTETGDGAVSVAMSDSIPVEVEATSPEGEDAKVTLTVVQPDASLIISGDASEMRYDMVYPMISMGDLTIEGSEIPEDLPLNLDFQMLNTEGFFTITDGDLRNYTSDATIASMTMNMEFEDPEGNGNGSFQFSLADMTQTTTGTLGEVNVAMSASEMVQGGFRQEGTLTHGPASYTIAADGPDGAFQMVASAASGTLFGTFNESGLSYGGTNQSSAISISGDMIPLPSVNLKMAESGGTLKMPLVPGEDPQNFGLGINLTGLEIDDMIWGLFDPTGQLPRDPATLIIDIAGKGILTEDYTSPEFAENPNAAPPGTLEEVSVNNLLLTLAGAELTGDGAFTFDNSIGIPIPSGVANLKLVGGNGLLDTLVAMGLVPEEQAMGARMMLGLFARPGDGADTLISTIEMKEDGSILANGQRIR